ncbi:hypothetical protein DPM19_01235 [Actinomadura craniellae]|uniref:Uncharacterized protein n=1 Tax=Actinomadura craniellae TaxID=2231787 RepID=A0A365HCQ5_9ACTN|nr:hypothetical protein DPM19_01235 [Actinomadura craniellae]
MRAAESKVRHLSLLSKLLRNLVGLGVPDLPGVAVTLRDAVPRVLFTGPNLLMDVQVGDDGREFVCRPPIDTAAPLAVTDVAGAAEVIAEVLRSCATDQPAGEQR